MFFEMNQQMAKLESFINKGDMVYSAVSNKGAYWHIAHSLKVLNGISEVLKNSKPSDYHPKFSWTKFIIMNTGYIPRGKGCAPQHTLPQDKITKEELLVHLKKVKYASTKLKDLPTGKTFRHPLFGWLNLKDTLTFMKIHTHLHLKIIKDINRSY
jgi:hypothetical protein